MKDIQLYNAKLGVQNQTFTFRVRNENKLENMTKRLMKENGSAYNQFNIDYDDKDITISYFAGGMITYKTFKYEIID